MRIPPPANLDWIGRRAATWLAIILLTGAALGCGDKPSLAGTNTAETRKTASLRQEIEEIQGVAGAPEVPVQRLAPGTISEELSIVGELTPRNSVLVKPLMDGRITFLKPIKVGDIVRKGELIAKIDDRDIEDEIENQQKQISLSQEKIKLDEQSQAQSKKDLEFDRQLVKEGFLNPHEFEKTEMNLKQAEITLSQSKIQLEMDRGKLSKALRQREKVPIVAPIGGMVVLPSHLTSGDEKSFNLLNEEIMSLEGTLVGTATPIFGIVSQDGYLAQCQANGRDKAKLHEGQTATITVITFKPVTVEGKIGKISLLQDAKTHAYKVWLSLAQNDPSFTSGLFVRANIQLARHEGTMAVRKEFVKERNGRPFVQVIQGGAIRDRWVTTGLAQDERIELASGVKAGEMLVASKEVFAAGQAAAPVEMTGEENEDEPARKIAPEEGGLPVVIKPGQLPRAVLTFVSNEETTPTRVLVQVKAVGPLDFKNLVLTVAQGRPLTAPEKVMHEGGTSSAAYELPVKDLVRGRNMIAVNYIGDTSRLRGQITLESVELWLYGGDE